MTAPAADPATRKPVVLLAAGAGATPSSTELWAGTKLIAVAGIGVLLTFYPGWVPIGLVAALVLTTAWLAHIPRGALPSIPRWLWFLFFLGGATATFAGGSPVDRPGLGGTSHWAGCSTFLRITAVSIVLLGLGAMVSWTTNVAEIAPAVATLGRPLRPLRIPVDDWAVALALALRAFPMLIDEFRVLYAARRLRPRRCPPPDGRAAAGGRWRSSIYSPRPSPWRCGGPTKWAMRLRPAGAPVKSPRRRRGRNGPTGWRCRSWSWFAVGAGAGTDAAGHAVSVAGSLLLRAATRRPGTMTTAVPACQRQRENAVLLGL